MVANAMKLALVIHTILDLGVIGHKTQSAKHKTGMPQKKKTMETAAAMKFGGDGTY